jgi:hypothetical protein
VNFVLPVVLGLVGVALGLIGYLGLRGKLARNRFAGVRTSAALRDDETFLLANRVAGLPNLVAGAVAIVSGAAALAVPDTALTVGLVGLVGAFAITVGATYLGHRAAEAVPAPEAPKGYGGCACGGGGCSAFARA